MTRKEERELAFTLIFEKIFNDELTIQEIVENAVEARLIEENTFAFSVAQLTYENCEEIDKLINENSVGITATTGEGLTEFGKGNGISVFSIITVE